MKWHSSAGKKQGGGEQSLFSKNALEQIFVEGIFVEGTHEEDPESE